MLDSFSFENHLGLRFVGAEHGVYLNYSDLRDYSWSYDVINNRISRFYMGVTNRKLPLVVCCSTPSEAVEVRNKLHELAEADIVAKRPGRISVGAFYTNGYITASKKSDYLVDGRYVKLELTLTQDDPAWYREKTYVFALESGENIGIAGGTDYPYDYPYDYATPMIGQNVINDAASESAFRLLIYGEAVSPTVNIGGHLYNVDVSVASGEVLEIDSLTKTITLINARGERLNYFDKRNRDSYIFQPIPAGLLAVDWPGNFGFDLIVIEKRSEPKWT